MAADIEIVAREILKTRERLNQLYVHHTGQDLQEIEKVMDRYVNFLSRRQTVLGQVDDHKWMPFLRTRDTFMDANQALEFGIIDEILIRREVSSPLHVPHASSLRIHRLSSLSVCAAGTHHSWRALRGSSCENWPVWDLCVAA